MTFTLSQDAHLFRTLEGNYLVYIEKSGETHLLDEVLSALVDGLTSDTPYNISGSDNEESFQTLVALGICQAVDGA